jgi:hypothetical protein
MGVSFLVLLSSAISISAESETETETGQKATLSWGKEQEGFCLSICLENQESSAGYPVLVNVRIKNISDEELRLVQTTPERDYSFIVKDSDGNAVPMLRYQQRMQGNDDRPVFRYTRTKVAPGQVIEYGANLSRCFDLTLTGNYTIQAERIVRKSGGGVVHLRSNIEAITIREKKRGRSYELIF